MNKLFSNNVIVFIGSIRKKMEEVYTYITIQLYYHAQKGELLGFTLSIIFQINN